ncbi:DUF2934 domain-containing protein [Pseudomonas sp. Au-Pse12]|uniref:DUF2934 domain-containing protein n=1 Tax=Pseudomonas sp. Au-Pse12 TaxID=2906459 RepID=UPI001E58B005|nr:DUF2934 domain-containing protein [Pseudomonas sp. Au-Pse12]MCE4053006.1 DUF2934 domain-containing protein [Pseudomonas sp. Au-Pse12]
MSTDDKRIREFAYQIWESEGKPEGQEARHWDMARKLAEAEALAPSTPPKAKPASAKPAARSAAKPKAKPAAAVVVPPGEKPATAKKPRAPRKPPAN